MNKYFLSFILSLAFLFGYAQMGYEGLPYSFYNHNLKGQHRIAIEVMPGVNVSEILKKEQELKRSLNENGKTIPFLYGHPIPTELNIENSGTIEYLDNGDRLWRLHIHSGFANTINLSFGKLKLFKGSYLFIYSADHRTLLGRFDERSNRPSGKFNTTVIKSEDIIVELYQSKSNFGKDQLEISKVIHGFRGFGTENNKARSFGSSGACNINVICSQGDDWRKEIRSVGMIVTDQGRMCTGSMINNTAQDGTPYFLTANHCIEDFFGQEEDVSDWIYMFNYESADCNPSIDGPTKYTLIGSKIVARNDDSDFGLLLLDTIPPLDYNLYYVGWNAVDAPTDSVVTIHHPSGDIKKISFENDSTVSDSSFAQATTKFTHWEIPDWDIGTTEPGSSGSPLFNRSHQVIGQLHGGEAKCGNDTSDYYGKIAYSWKGDTSHPKNYLQFWLDPINSGVLELPGRDYNVPHDTTDATISSLKLGSSFCGDTLTTSFIMRSLGFDSLVSAKIHYILDSQSYSFNWNGLLRFYETDTIQLPLLPLSEGSHTLKIYFSEPNGKVDEKPYNDTIFKSFNVKHGSDIELTFLTDFFSNQTKIWFYSDSDSSIYYKTALEATTLYQNTFCLPDGCYTLRITDEGGNGICCDYEEGYYAIIFKEDTVAYGGEFLDTAWVNFCIQDGEYLSIGESKENLHHISVFPNPASNLINIDRTGVNIEKLAIVNLLGELVYEDLNPEQNILKISTKKFPKGFYFLSLEKDHQTIVKKILIE